MVLCVGFQVVNVDVGKTRQQQLQFLLVEDGYRPARDDVVETLEESGQLKIQKENYVEIKSLITFDH